MIPTPRDVWGFPESQRWIYLLLGICLVASFLVPTAWVAQAPTVCPLRSTTGIPCPGCGLTRSFVATAEGDVVRAFGFHAFGPPLMLLFGTMVTTRWITRSSRSPLFPDGPMAHPGVRIVVVAWLGWALARACGLLPPP